MGLLPPLILRSRQRREQARMALVPALAPEVRCELLDTGVVMAIYRRKRRGVQRALARLLCRPEVGQLILDNIGTYVIRQIDGHTSVAALASRLAAAYGFREAGSRRAVLQFLDMLHRRGVLRYGEGGRSQGD